MDRPPLGVIPKDIWEYKRMQDLSRAIKEYIDCGRFEPVKEWIEELSHLLSK
jgi:hypothetical protein